MPAKTQKDSRDCGQYFPSFADEMHIFAIRKPVFWRTLERRAIMRFEKRWKLHVDKETSSRLVICVWRRANRPGRLPLHVTKLFSFRMINHIKLKQIEEIVKIFFCTILHSAISNDEASYQHSDARCKNKWCKQGIMVRVRRKDERKDRGTL